METLLIAGAVTIVTASLTYGVGFVQGKRATCEKHAAEIKKLQGRIDAYRTTVPAMQQELRKYHEMERASRTVMDNVGKLIQYGRTVVAK